jgi:hypothetical protein
LRGKGGSEEEFRREGRKFGGGKKIEGGGGKGKWN